MQAQGYSDQMSQYKFIEQLSKSKMKAEHKGTGKTVVISNTEQQFSSEEQIVELTLQSHLQTIEQNKLVSMYEHLVVEGYVFTVRPYMNRGNLIEFMRDS